MADTKISNLPAASSVAGADLVTIVQSGSNKKATVAQLNAFTGFRAYSGVSDQSIPGSSTPTKITLDTEEYDTDNTFDSTTNYRHTPTKAGKWLYFGSVRYQDGVTARLETVMIYKNGNAIAIGQSLTGNQISLSRVIPTSVVVNMNGTTDYIELMAMGSDATARTVFADATATYLYGVYLGDS